MVVLYRENREDDEQIWFNPEKILVSNQNFLMIKPDLFQEFVERIRSLVKKKDTFWRKALI